MHKTLLTCLIVLSFLPSCSHQKPTQQDTPASTQTGDATNADTQKSSWFAKQKEKRAAHKTLRDKSYQELRQKLNEYKEAGDAYMALKYAEQLYAQCENIDEICDLLLICADLCFQQQNYKKASILYNDFIRLYPSIPQKTEHAYAHLVFCSEQQQTTTTDRDQTTTRETIILAEAFLKRSDVFTTYTQQIQNVLDRCNQRLFDHEMGIVNFYIHKGSLKSAEKRLTALRQGTIIKLSTTTEPLLLIQECRLALAQHNNELGERKAQELAAAFPQYTQHEYLKALPELKQILQTPVTIAQKQPSSTSFADRF